MTSLLFGAKVIWFKVSEFGIHPLYGVYKNNFYVVFRTKYDY